MNLRFEAIDLQRRDAYRDLLSRCPQAASDYSFLNLWGWTAHYGLEWAWENDLVWIRQTRPATVFWAPVGPWETIDWQLRLKEICKPPCTFIRVPQKLADSWRTRLGAMAVIEEQRGHWDYLYAVRDLIDLKGNRYHKKRNLLNQFIRKYPFSYVAFEPHLIEQARGMQQDWCTWRDCESSDILAAENQAIAKILKDWQHFSDALGGAIFVDGAMAAYTVAEALTDETVVIHFEKGDTRFKGIYQAINQLFLARSAAHFSLVNREQDLNDDGLRRAKLSYLPVDFLRKYRVALPA